MKGRKSWNLMGSRAWRASDGRQRCCLGDDDADYLLGKARLLWRASRRVRR